MGHPAGRVAKYYVVTAGAEVGIFTNYTRYAESVRDHMQTWSGRGKIPFAAGVDSLSFLSRAEAENHFESHLPDVRPIPFLN